MFIQYVFRLFHEPNFLRIVQKVDTQINLLLEILSIFYPGQLDVFLKPAYDRFAQ